MANPHINNSINQVSSLFQNIKPISALEFDVGLPLQRGLLYIRVKFDGQFPSTAPKIQVASNVVHPLINDRKIVLCPEFQNWSPNITLLSVIQNIHKSFTLNPPVPETPAFPKFQELLQNWNKSIEDDQDIIEFVDTIEDVQLLIRQRDELLENNIALVNQNLKRKEEYESLLNEHQGEIQEIEGMTGKLAELMKQVDILNRQFSQEKVMEKLREMENGFNKQAADVLKSFMKKDISIEEFVQQYQEPTQRAKFIAIVKEGSKAQNKYLTV